MITLPDRQSVSAIANPGLRAYALGYIDIQDDFKSAVTEFGLPFDQEGALQYRTRLSRRIEQLRAAGCTVANNDKSFSVGWISPACVACRFGAGTETFLTSTQCPRNCYFCFNPNQVDYEYYLSHVHDVAAELGERHRRGVDYAHLALTGGEPLMHEAETLAFFNRAHELYPKAYTRLYTSGAGMDEEVIAHLAQAGLREVRFSIKLDEPPEAIEAVLATMAQCVGTFEAVMVEMPVMPGEEQRMRDLLMRLDALGVKGVNLLELCFPLHNAEEFARRGYRLKPQPYQVLYDYWYAGGLPIAGSEEACLNLVEFALRVNLSLGVHYCSLENKVTGQVYQQNAPYANSFEHYAMSPRDHFLKAAKVFGSDAVLVQGYFDSLGVRDYARNADHGFLVFPVSRIPDLAALFGTLEVGVSYAIVEGRDDGPALRELAVGLTTPTEFDLDCDW